MNASVSFKMYYKHTPKYHCLWAWKVTAILVVTYHWKIIDVFWGSMTEGRYWGVWLYVVDRIRTGILSIRSMKPCEQTYYQQNPKWLYQCTMEWLSSIEFNDYLKLSEIMIQSSLIIGSNLVMTRRIRTKDLNHYWLYIHLYLLTSSLVYYLNDYYKQSTCFVI